MKIQKLAIETLTSPFANILAIANLTMVALMGSFGFNRLDAFGKLVHDLNAPAIAVSVIIIGSYDCLAVVPPLIYLQWIVIAGFAKFLTAEIRQPPID
ncbi:MAG: hypothetical protein ABIU09_12930 [Pyrinomonadaceae bacterium]